MDGLTNGDLARSTAARRAEGIADSTINRQLQSLGRALRYMLRIHGAVMPELDLRGVMAREPEERMRELTIAEQKRLFTALRLDLHPLVSFALMTGARLSTILGLRWSDTDHDAGRMLFLLKGGLSHRFPISPDIRALLSAQRRAELPADRPYVFTYLDHSSKAKVRRRIIQNSHVFDDFRAALVAAGIEDFRFHDLRHTFATRLLRRTGNIKLVSQLLATPRSRRPADTPMSWTATWRMHWRISASWQMPNPEENSKGPRVYQNKQRLAAVPASFPS